MREKFFYGIDLCSALIIIFITIFKITFWKELMRYILTVFVDCAIKIDLNIDNDRRYRRCRSYQFIALSSWVATHSSRLNPVDNKCCNVIAVWFVSLSKIVESQPTTTHHYREMFRYYAAPMSGFNPVTHVTPNNLIQFDAVA